MTDAIATTEAFLAEWAKGRDAIRQAVRDYFTPTTTWENVGMSLTTGPDEALAALDGFEANLGMVAMTVDIHSIVALGDKVLTERVDHILTADGSVAASIRIMGIIETSGGKITAWRDYFDTAGLLGGG